jgi:Carboxypeptidase regulatory-like domain
MAGRFRSPGAFRAAVLGLACALPPLLLLPATASSQQQTASISGRLIDQDSRAPVGGASIALVGTRFGVTSDSTGQFSQRDLSAGIYVVQVHAIGYTTASWVLRVAPGDAVSRVLELERLPVQLPPVVVERRPGFAEQRVREFERRRAAGRGYFMTEQEIAHANPRTLGDLFRSVPGVRMQCRGSAAGCRLRMARAPRECSPDFVVDGFPATYSTSLDMPTIGIIGIEVYRTLSETPLDFLRPDNVCGTIVIWTRSGPG